MLSCVNRAAEATEKQKEQMNRLQCTRPHCNGRLLLVSIDRLTNTTTYQCLLCGRLIVLKSKARIVTSDTTAQMGDTNG
jgi:hypothetical protein